MGVLLEGTFGLVLLSFVCFFVIESYVVQVGIELMDVVLTGEEHSCVPSPAPSLFPSPARHFLASTR